MPYILPKDPKNFNRSARSVIIERKKAQPPRHIRGRQRCGCYESHLGEGFNGYPAALHCGHCGKWWKWVGRFEYQGLMERSEHHPAPTPTQIEIPFEFGGDR